MTAAGDLDRARIGELHAGELARFRHGRPRSLAMIARARRTMPNGAPMAWMVSDNDQPVYIDLGLGAGFTDIDGFSYVDFNASDLAMLPTGRNWWRWGGCAGKRIWVTAAMWITWLSRRLPRRDSR